MIRVSCETRDFRDRDENLEGKTLNEVYDALKQLMDLPEKSSLTPKINDSSVEWTDTAHDDDTVEFMKESREKGL